MAAACVIYVVDLDRMAAFYEQCFGLPVAESGDGYRVLESIAWTLSLVLVPSDVAGRVDITVPARRRTEVPIKLAFAVESIDETRITAAALGGRVDPPDARWAFRGFDRCDGADPEGNVIQLLEPLSPDHSG